MSKTWSIIFVVSCILAVFIISIFLYLYKNSNAVQDPETDSREIIDVTFNYPDSQGSFEIPGVPYIGFHNHVGKWSRFMGDLDAAIGSIMYYWNPNREDSLNIALNFLRPIRQEKNALAPSFEFTQLVLQEEYNQEFVSSVVDISVEDLSKYINDGVSTPLITFLPVINGPYPEGVDNYPAYVLYGVNYEQNTVKLHSFWEGSAITMTIAEYKSRQGYLPEQLQGKYLVIQPRNFSYTRNFVAVYTSTEYTPVQVVELGREMFQWYPIANNALLNKNYDTAREYFTKIIEHPEFDDNLPPILKVLTLYRLGDIYSKKFKDNDKAIELIEKAVALNHDLDQPFKDWPGYEVRRDDYTVSDMMASPHRVLGDAYVVAGEFEKAREQYELALIKDYDQQKALWGLEALKTDNPLQALINFRPVE